MQERPTSVGRFLLGDTPAKLLATVRSHLRSMHVAPLILTLLRELSRLWQQCSASQDPPLEGIGLAEDTDSDPASRTSEDRFKTRAV